MAYSAEEVAEAEKAADGGGKRVPPDLADIIRAVRNKEQFQRYDTVAVGPTARQFDDGWFDTFAAMARASTIGMFSGRNEQVGEAYTNQTTERYDYAQDIYSFSIELIAPVGLGDFDEQATDTVFWPQYWITQVAAQMSVVVKLADADTILTCPLTHVPASVGPSGLTATDTAGPIVVPGTNGIGYFKNAWVWPEPIMVPAKGRISCNFALANPLKEFLLLYPNSPGNKQVPQVPPGPQGQTNTLPNWFLIRGTFRGPRYLQLRGARSA